MRHTALSLQRNTRFPPSMADVRGFEVRTRDHNDKVGKVDDLVCGAEGQIRYLDVGLGGLFNKKRVLLPVGVARADRTNDVVWIAGMTKEQIKDLPEYAGNVETITDDYEKECCSPFRARGTGTLADASGGEAAESDLYDQGQLYADRGGATARDARLVFAPESSDARGSEQRM